MAGAVKVLTAIVQGLRGERTLLHPDSGALIIAEWLLRGDGVNLAGAWFVQHRYIAWISVAGGVLVELAAIAPIFARWTQPIITFGLIAMHVGIGLTMDVWFPENVALLAVMFLAGPAVSGRKGLLYK